MNLLDIMQKRRSVRKYTDEPITKEIITQIIQAGLLSPTGHGYRPWQLIVVQDKEKLLELAKCRASARMLEGAQAAIVVLGDESISDTWIEDCSSVMTNMHLMADSLGVGSCWIQGRLRMKDEVETTEGYVRKLFGFPEHLRLLAILSLGMPDGHPAGHELSELMMEKVHFEQFN